jgi:hypothetical protein
MVDRAPVEMLWLCTHCGKTGTTRDPTDPAATKGWTPECREKAVLVYGRRTKNDHLRLVPREEWPEGT